MKNRHVYFKFYGSPYKERKPQRSGKTKADDAAKRGDCGNVTVESLGEGKHYFNKVCIEFCQPQHPVLGKSVIFLLV